MAIIPARGGSKRIPRKNVLPFAGVPMITRSIQVARESELFAQVIVSTDDEEIAEVARAAGADVPFVRPLELADDHTPTIPVIRHALSFAGGTPDFVCCLYATAPFVEAGDLRRGLEVLAGAGSEVDFVFPVASFPAPISRALRLDGQGNAEMINPENDLARSQDLGEAYYDAGQFYWGAPEAFQSNSGILSARCRAIVMPRHRVQDIDTPDDWERAEILYRCLHHS